jgi:hypothetical protein
MWQCIALTARHRAATPEGTFLPSVTAGIDFAKLYNVLTTGTPSVAPNASSPLVQVLDWIDAKVCLPAFGAIAGAMGLPFKWGIAALLEIVTASIAVAHFAEVAVVLRRFAQVNSTRNGTVSPGTAVFYAIFGLILGFPACKPALQEVSRVQRELAAEKAR